MFLSEPRLLERIGYPTDKTVLLRRAEKINAPNALPEAIRRLPPGLFRTRHELVVAVEAISSS